MICPSNMGTSKMLAMQPSPNTMTGLHKRVEGQPPSYAIPGYFTDSLREMSRLIELKTGEFLFHQEAIASACYRIIRGSIRLTRSAAGAFTATVQQAEAGEWLFEPGPYDDKHESAAAANVASLVLAVSARQFRVELRRNPQFASAWGLEMAEAGKRIRRRVERLALLRARERVVHYLVTESTGNDGAVRRTGSMQAWAEHLGIAAETLSRAIAELRADGCIESEGREFRLIGSSFQ